MLVTLYFTKLKNPDNDIDSETLNPDFKENMFIIDIDLFYVVNEHILLGSYYGPYFNYISQRGLNRWRKY